MLRPGGTFLLVAHDSTNLTEGTGGPQDPAVLMTAEDVVGDLTAAGLDVEVLRAERVAREVTAATARRRGAAYGVGLPGAGGQALTQPAAPGAGLEVASVIPSPAHRCWLV